MERHSNMSGNDKKNDRERQECQWAEVQTYIHTQLAMAVGKEMSTGRQEKICLLNSHWKLPESEKSYNSHV